MPLENPRKTVSPQTISCGERAEVTISFEASSALSSEPTDIVLLIDHSSSMRQPKLANAQAAANDLVDMVTAASGGGNTIERGSRIGIVGFSSHAETLLDFSTDTVALHDAINSLVIEGATNHRQAFETAEAMLSPKTEKRRIVVMFTDGATSVGGDPGPVAKRIKDSGAEIYCIGLMSDSTDPNKWASTPLETHVAMTEDSAQLSELFRQIGSEIVLAGAYSATLEETVTEEFEIVGLNAVSHGDARITSPQTLHWTTGTVGITAEPVIVSLSFQICHIGQKSGVRPVNQALTYQDRDGNSLTFPSPDLQIHCGGTDVVPEPCPEPTELTVEGCADATHVVLAPVNLQGLGRIVQMDVTLKAVCPGKRVAASIVLMELSPDGTEIARGVKHILVPAQTGEACQDVTLNCVQFSLLEALDVGGKTDSICNPRRFAARVIANYVDTDFTYCEAQTAIL